MQKSISIRISFTSVLVASLFTSAKAYGASMSFKTALLFLPLLLNVNFTNSHLAYPGDHCTSANDCFNHFPCENNQCCSDVGNTCYNFHDCCDGLSCHFRNPGEAKCCVNARSSCSSTNDCCYSLKCYNNKCCAIAGNSCINSHQCCDDNCLNNKCYYNFLIMC